jgi:hypothetical protein
MVFSGALRCSMYRTGYSRKTYRETCIDLFIAGIQPTGRSVAPSDSATGISMLSEHLNSLLF